MYFVATNKKRLLLLCKKVWNETTYKEKNEKSFQRLKKNMFLSRKICN